MKERREVWWEVEVKGAPSIDLWRHAMQGTLA